MVADPDRTVDVLIVGGGLGGLALAVGLGPNSSIYSNGESGLDWLLAESAPELRTATGTLIGVGNNGLVALSSISDKIVPSLKKQAQLSTRSEGHVRPMDPTAAPEPTSTTLASPLHTIRWAATQSVLAEQVDHSRVRCNHKCTGYTAGDDGVITCHFKGQPDIKARLVIGADGVRSAIRRSMLPDDPGPRYLGFMNWNAVRHVPGSSSAPLSDTIKVIYDKRGGFRTMVYLINAGCDYQFWQVRMSYDAPTFTNGTGPGSGVPGSKARVIERLKEHGWEDAIQEVESTDESAIYERAMWDRLPLESWSSAGGRVVLLGDAAHAMYSGPGQGARTAFEDANQLLLALKQHWPDTAAMAQQYEEARIHRATIIQHMATSMANLKELAQEMNAYWQQLEEQLGESRDEAWVTRFREVQEWLNSYPTYMHGLPDSKYMTPDKLKAFREHCAAATWKHLPSCQLMVKEVK